MALREAGENVDPAFRQLPFDEKAKIFMQCGVPVDPDGALAAHQDP